MKIDNCGSFRENGFLGTHQDIVTKAFTRALPLAITRVIMDRATYVIYAETVVRHANAKSELPVDGLPLLGSTVEWVTDLPAGTINFHAGDELVCETNGWVA